MRSNLSAARLLACAATAAVLALGLGGCKTTSDDITSSIGRGETDQRRAADKWGERYRDDPTNPQAAVEYATALRATGQRAQAVAILEQASIQNPQNMAVLGAYGRALADTGNYQQALDVLSRAHTPERPDPRILSATGAVLDQMGKHSDAQRYYASALKMTPNDPSILTNLGLSYALSKDLKRAEVTLRRAVVSPGADPKAQQNLALVVGLQGRTAEAEDIARTGLPPVEAEASVTDLRQMLEERRTERTVEAREKPAPVRRKPLPPPARITRSSQT